MESLERENDRGIESLSERIGLLKQATSRIRDEADSQHSLLDRMVRRPPGRAPAVCAAGYVVA